MSASKSASHGLIFDIAVFASNVGLSFYNLNHWLKQQVNEVTGTLLLLAVMAQLLGASP
jgi:hypothetical protein